MLNACYSFYVTHYADISQILLIYTLWFFLKNMVVEILERVTQSDNVFHLFVLNKESVTVV